MTVPCAAHLVLSNAEKKELMRLAHFDSTTPKILFRIKIVQAAASGIGNRAIARKLDTTVPTVLLWRRRYESDKLKGILRNRPRSGRPKFLNADLEAAIVRATLTTQPPEGTRWTVRRMADVQKVSYAFVFRVWKKHGLKPYQGLLG